MSRRNPLAGALLSLLLTAAPVSPAARSETDEDGIPDRTPARFSCGSGPDLALRMKHRHDEAKRLAGPVRESHIDVDLGNVAVLYDGGDLVVSGFSDTTAIAQQFYQTHPDDYDYLVIFLSSAYNFDVQIEGGFAFHRRVASDVLGIGVDPVDNAATLGLTTTRLRSILQMNDLLEYLPRFDHILPQFAPDVEGVEILGHEVGHQFLAFADVPGEGMPGRSGSHWSFFMNTGASVLEGCTWQEDGGGDFISTVVFEGYSELDHYLMGLRSEATVTEPIFVIQSPTGTGGHTESSLPESGVTIGGTRRDITMAEVIAAEGTRVPAWDAAPHEFPLALALVVPDSSVAPIGDLERLESFRRTFVDWFAGETDGVGSIDTGLPGIVVDAAFGAERFAGPAPLTVAFEDRSAGPVSSHLWEFGDGATSPLTDPVHTYTSPGFYTVRLTVDGAGGPDSHQHVGFVVVGTLTEETHDDFETFPGVWNVAGSNDASSGGWLQADPVGTEQLGLALQPEDDLTADPGATCWVTGNGAVGGVPGDNDVDGGTVTIQSPVFDLSGRVLPIIEMGLWYSNGLGGEPGTDKLLLQASGDGGATWFDLERIRRSGDTWRTYQVRLTDAILPTGQVKIRVVASDLGLGSLVEAAIDEFRILSVPGESDVDGDAIPDLIDNCPEAVNPSQFDGDQDGTGNTCDCDDADPEVAQAVGEDVVLSGDPTTTEVFHWTPDALADSYNVYRGMVAPGAAFAYTETCFKKHTTLTEVSDISAPAAGGYHFYLVAPENGCGEAGLGSASDGTPRFLPSTCPPPIGPPGE